MTILDRIEGVLSEATTAPKLGQKDVGIDYLGEQAGGCQRAGWYKVHDTPITNPQADRLTVAKHIHDKIVDLYVARMKKVTVEFLSGIKRWTIKPKGGGEGALTFGLDYIYKVDEEVIGVIIFTGSGYGFRAEVFGTRSTAGGIKIDHLVQCWSILAASVSPLTLTKLDVLYVDRDRGDSVCYKVIPADVPIVRGDVDAFIAETVQPNLPACSYKKQWTNAEEVAKLYAEKQISKARYETWKDSGIGGDWHCEYCPFLKKCEEDGET